MLSVTVPLHVIQSFKDVAKLQMETLFYSVSRYHFMHIVTEMMVHFR